MKKVILSLFATATLLLFATSGLAATADPAQKIGVVDVQQVLAQSPQTKKVADSIKSKFKKREAQLKKDQEKLQANQSKLDKDGSVMSDKDRAKLRDSIISGRAAFQGRVAAFQQDVSEAQAKAMQNLLNDIKTIVNSIAQKEHYTVVVEKRSIAYVADGFDITSKVISAMKKK